MTIEEYIFQKCKLNDVNLISYGFKLDNDLYTYETNILDNNFKVIVNVDRNNKVQVKVLDLEVNEEYINFRNDNLNGTFSSKVKEEITDILNDIKEKCSEKTLFLSEQSNRVMKLINDLYHVKPEFLWEKYDGNGVFRNTKNKKWFAIILNLNKNKIMAGNGIIEVVNVKLSEDMIQELLNKDGFYPAYHMNKKKWISIILDDTLTDDEIMKYITKSYDLINK